MPQVDMSQIPAQTQQAIAAQQGATNQDEMNKVLQMLAEDPNAMAAVLQQIGLPIDAEQLMGVAENWVDKAAQQATGEEATNDEGTEVEQASLPPNEEATSDYATGAAAEEEDVEEATPPTGTEPVEETDESRPGVMEANAMPRRGAGAGGNPIDDLISAQMMQSAVGNPNAPVPVGGAIGRQQRPGIPASRMPPSAAAGGARGGGNQQQQMIAALFRQAQAARRAGKPVTGR